MKKSKISPSIDCTLGEFEILMIKSKISRSIDCTLGEFEILMNKSKISLSIGCTLGEFEICRTSYPTWLSAKQYTIGESFSTLTNVFFSKKNVSGFSFANFLFPLVILLFTNASICRLLGFPQTQISLKLEKSARGMK